MTQFIESFATHQLLPPYHSDNSKVYGFFFEIKVDAIQAYCDVFLNIGDQSSRPFLYRPITDAPFGILTFTDYPALCSTDKEIPRSLGVTTSHWDHLRQKELSVAVPVNRYRLTSANVLVEPTVQWVQPVVVLDNATSAFSGREILGLEALYGHVDVVDPPLKPGGVSIRVSLPSWETFAPDACEQMLPFASIDCEAALPGATDEDHRQQSDTLGLTPIIGQLRQALPHLRDFGDGLLPETMQMVLLKQFRDAGDPNLAIHQSLVGVRRRYSDIVGMRLYDPGAISVQFTDGAMVDEILNAFLDLHFLTQSVRDGIVTRTLKTAMAFSFTATVDADRIETLFTFRDPPDADVAIV
ncbi:MAG TPA: hypothetical protein VGN38_04895 [Caulobacteraceae bacterium]|jgi:hypothetical protein|nr:hypothetical protein [Caulobacteraceae bacterium]